MDLRITSTDKRARQAFTLIEMMFTLAVAAIVVAAILAFFAFSNRSFASLANYLDLDQKTQLALDKMSREIRQAANVTSFNSTNLTFTANNGDTLSYSFDPNQQTLTRTQGSTNETLLTECNSLTFSVFTRSPSNNTFNPYTTGSAGSVKLVELTWNCSRGILGVTANSESMQSAKIVLRKK